MNELSQDEIFRRKLKESLSRAAKVRRAMAEVQKATTTTDRPYPTSVRSREALHSAAKAQ